MVFLGAPMRRSSFSSILALRIIAHLTFSYPRPIHAYDVDRGTEFCPMEATVDLSNAENNDSGFLDESGLFFPRNTARLRDGLWTGCICDIKPCLVFCPPKNASSVPEDYVVQSAIPRVHTENLTLDVADALRFETFVWDPCQGKPAYFLEPKRREGDEFRLMKNGSIFMPRWNQTRFLDFRKSCFRLRENDSVYTPRVCFPEEDTDEYKVVKYIGVLVAVPFLIATVLVYSVLPELRNIHGTTLRCYLCCLLVTHVALAADRIPPPDHDAGHLCLFLGFTIYSSFLASFFWLNTMCIDMWWRLGGFGSLKSSGKQHDDEKFIAYSIYAWGSAVILTVICISMEFAPGIPGSLILPGFRLNACWFSTKTAAGLYFYGPIGATLACNICLFVSTTIKMVKHKKDTQRHLNTGDSKRHDDNKQWFALHVKLFIVMGISWSTEVISWLWKGPKYLWYVTDMVNALQGFLIFLIFVWKKKIFQSLRKRFTELKITRRGCNFVSRSSDSPATTASLDDSIVRCNVSVLVLEELKTPAKTNSGNPDNRQDISQSTSVTRIGESETS